MADTTGSRIKAARKRAALTQKELARAVGVSETAANAWEQDTRLPETDSLLRLSRALDVSIDYLLLGRRPAGIDHLVGGIAELLEEARALQAGSAVDEANLGADAVGRRRIQTDEEDAEVKRGA